MNTVQIEMRLPSAVEHVGLLSPAPPDGAGKSNWNSSLEVRDQADVVDRHSACLDPLLDMLANDTQGLFEPRVAPGSVVGQGFNEGLKEQSSDETADLDSPREQPGFGGPAQPLRRILVPLENNLQLPHIEEATRTYPVPNNGSNTNKEFITGILDQINMSQEETTQQQNAIRWVENVINENGQNTITLQTHTRRQPQLPPTQQRPGTLRGGSRRSEPIKKRTSAHYRMASLNMNGRGIGGPDSNQNKWNWIEELMAENKLAMITLQETHLDQETLEQIQEFKRRDLLIENTADPDNPTGRGGVAIVLRKKSTNINRTTFKVIVPGRALLMQHPWHGDKVFTFLAIYAPAGSNVEKIKFYENLNEIWSTEHLPPLDGWGGDFNLAPTSNDRLPAREDHREALAAFEKFRSRFDLIDGWRRFNEKSTGFTFKRANSRSRIDRIYLTNNLIRESLDWNIKTPNITSDHDMVTATMVDPIAPHIGKGRWTVPLAILKHKGFKKEVTQALEHAKREMDSISYVTGFNQASNKQTIWKRFKDKTRDLARERAKILVPKLKIKVDELTEKRNSIINDENIPEERKLREANKLDSRIQELNHSLHIERRKTSKANAHLNNEKPTKWFSRKKQPPRPKEYITEIVRPNSSPMESTNDTREMTRIADQYHDELQDEVPDHGIDKEEAWQSVKQNINRRVTQEERSKLAQNVRKKEVDNILKISKKGKAAGIDGLPTELYQMLQDLYKEKENTEDKIPNIVEILTAVFNEIEKFGIPPKTEFTKGWMCPIYKKKERNNLANYRPITVLNSDYKILTKTLSVRLAEAAPEGGKNLISLEDLRDAIGLMRLKAYLNLGKSRATWTHFADDIARNAINKEGEKKLPNNNQRVNPLLQNWDIIGTKVPAYLKELVKLSKKYRVTIEAKNPTVEMSREMPAWHHKGADPAKRQLNNVGRSKCLQNNHEVVKVGDLADMVARKKQQEHDPLNNKCKCQDCTTDRLFMCEKPALCTNHAEQILDTLLPKWNPLLINEAMDKSASDDETVNEKFKAPTKPTCLRDSFRVFTNAKEYNSFPPPAMSREEIDHGGNPTQFYISGISKKDKEGENVSGGGLVSNSQYNSRDSTIRPPTYIQQTGGAAAIVTAICALRKCNPDMETAIASKASAITKNMLKNVELWEQKGYIGIPNANLLMPLTALLKEHRAGIQLQHVDKGHPDCKKVEGAHKLALAATKKLNTDHIDLSINEEWRTKGAQLSTMTQKLAYQGIRTLTFPNKRKIERQKPSHMKTYQKNIERIKADIKDWSGSKIEEGDIWTACTRSANATKEQNIWTWKAIHNTYWVGRKWLHCIGYEERAKCHECGVIEDMEHILVQCKKPGQAETWKLAQKFLLQRSIQIPNCITLGLALGGALLHPRTNEPNEKAPGGKRLMEIVMREATALIWQLRNNHVIKQNGDPNKIPTEVEIRNQFLFRMNQRLQLDLTLINKLKFGKKALAKAIVLNTWQDIIKVDEPPDDWTKLPGVLVGMGDE
ncbi:hypothetical protein D9757_007442 [Collybiopsis confluens]|uniref:Endonuclease/exonuclease/phosphatase domain-containing protein n=1 Tax=Collybiopsis confluens TaxID=2823264 RepID=A0A8H5HJT0_9AGAR|nr:hypothetical protein D9757_007442 [Collybiopsis confluens]